MNTPLTDAEIAHANCTVYRCHERNLDVCRVAGLLREVRAQRDRLIALLSDESLERLEERIEIYYHRARIRQLTNYESHEQRLAGLDALLREWRDQ